MLTSRKQVPEVRLSTANLAEQVAQRANLHSCGTLNEEEAQIMIVKARREIYKLSKRSGDRWNDRNRDIFLRSSQTSIASTYSKSSSSPSSMSAKPKSRPNYKPKPKPELRLIPKSSCSSARSNFISLSATVRLISSKTLLLLQFILLIWLFSSATLPITVALNQSPTSNSIERQLTDTKFLLHRHFEEPDMLILWPTTAKSGITTTEQKNSNFSEHQRRQQPISLKNEKKSHNQKQSDFYQDQDMDHRFITNVAKTNRKGETAAIDGSNKLRTSKSIRIDRGTKVKVNGRVGDGNQIGRYLTLRRKRNLDCQTNGDAAHDGHIGSISDTGKRRESSQWQAIIRHRRLSDLAPDEKTNNGVQSQPPSSADKCDKFFAFWTSFRGAYPSLASYLFSLSFFAQSNEYQQVKFAQIKRGIARLLEEADHLVREQLAPKLSDLNAATIVDSMLPLPGTNIDQQRTKPTNSWLNRVIANPMYAKLIHHLQNQQLTKQLQHNLGGDTLLVDQPVDNLNVQTKELSGSSDTHVYGRVVHYPHEMEVDDKSVSTIKTLDKLRQLNQQQKELQSNRPTANNRVADFISSTDAEIDQGNRISPLANDGEPWPRQAIIRTTGEFGSDSARDKYVYGNVLLRPNQANNNHGQNSLGTLRHLSANLDRSTPLKEEEEVSLADNHDTSESYGRILVSPPNILDKHNNNRGKSQYSHGVGRQSGEQSRWTSSVSTLDKLSQQLEPNQFEFRPSADLDELTAQQNSHSMAAHTSDNANEAGNEFEGVWHSAPLEHPEVRQVRAGGKADGQLVRMTSSSKDVFLVD